MCSLQILLLIGENFDHADEICGAVVNVRMKADKIGVYLKISKVQSLYSSIIWGWYKNVLRLILLGTYKSVERSWALNISTTTYVVQFSA